MGNIAEDWEPFEIQVTIEGEIKSLLIVPDREETKYAVFDQHTLLGAIWKEPVKTGTIWCGEGLAVKALLMQIAEQMEDYFNNRPI